MIPSSVGRLLGGQLVLLEPVRCSRRLGRVRPSAFLTFLAGAGVFFTTTACGIVEDRVFEAKLLNLVTEPITVHEGDGVEPVLIKLQAPVLNEVRATFEVRGIEAQDGCQKPDFREVEDTLTFSAGSDQSAISLWIGQDEVAELDERLEIVLSNVSGGTLLGPTSVQVVIEDDDRDGIVDASDYGAVPNSGRDETAALQAGLDAARDLGRGVLVVPPGDYEVVHLDVAPGTTLSGRGARFLRPADSDVGTRTINVYHQGPDNSQATLVEGVVVDGRRDLQGPYQGYEHQDDHLIMLEGGSDEPGRVVVAVEDVHVSSGTGDGIGIGPNSDASLCHIRADNIWRDAIGLHGGRSSLKVRSFEATATEGTSGIWLDGYILGYDGNRTVDVEIEDATLDTGDVEVQVVDGSSVVMRNLSMTEPPFRVWAIDSSVEVVGSVIQIGVPSTRHNNFTFAHDVRLTGSTIVSSERVDEEPESEEMDREFSTLSLRWTSPPDFPTPLAGEHQLTLDGCQLMLGGDIEPTDTVYGIANPESGGSVVVRNSDLGSGFAGWFAPGCLDCQLLQQ